MEFFDKFSELDKIKDWFFLNKDKLKKMILPAILVVALLVFFFSGKDDGVTMTAAAGDTAVTSTDGTTVAEDVAEANNVGTGNTASNPTGKIYVDIGGEVNTPGVYEVVSGTRLFEVIEQAGGLTENANIDVINQAEAVYDGQKILIASYEETENGQGSTSSTQGTSAASGNETTNSNTSSSVTQSDKVNLNTADSAMLQTIPGIGPSKAERIIEYRTSNGRFNSIEDIKNVSGIGNKTYESIKDYLVV